MYKQVVFIIFAYSLACLISGRPLSNMEGADKTVYLPTLRNRPGAGNGSPRAEQMDRGARQTSGNSHPNSGDGYDNSTSYSASGQVAGDDNCDLSIQDVNLFRQIQLNPLYALSVMAELEHENFAASRRKRQGSVNGYEIPKDVCREVESRLNVNTTEANNNIFVSCPSAGSHRVTYHCHFYPNRYPRYLIQAKPCRTGGCLSCNNDDSFCGEHNITVTVAEPSGNCRWTAISIQVRVGCRCNIPPRRS